MFLQLVTDHEDPRRTVSNAIALFQYHPLLITALVERYWGNRYLGEAFPFDSWPEALTVRIINDFSPAGISERGLHKGPVNWDHLIYAYLIENTRIYSIFRQLLRTYQAGELLEAPSVGTQRFLQNTEALLFSNPFPTTVWNVSSRLRPDEAMTRASVYWRMFGLELEHVPESTQERALQKTERANIGFAPTFEVFAREVWRGILNARNIAGPNNTDDDAIASSARELFDMLVTRRHSGNISREEFRAVAVMSWLHLAISFDSPIVLDLQASASSPERRLSKIADRIAMTPHPHSQAFFDLAQPFSLLLQSIEQGAFNYPVAAQMLYQVPAIRTNVEIVIDKYSAATGRNLRMAAVVPVRRELITASG
jgi:hypothetical protein